MASFIDIRFVSMTESGKTKRFEVYTSDGKMLLGRIQWMTAWRCYAFYPFFPTIYEQVCLREIAAFIERETQIRKATA